MHLLPTCMQAMQTRLLQHVPITARSGTLECRQAPSLIHLLPTGMRAMKTQLLHRMPIITMTHALECRQAGRQVLLGLHTNLMQ